MSRNNSVVFTLCLSTTGIGYRYQSLLTVCNLEEVREGVHVLKVLKQKLLVDGVGVSATRDLWIREQENTATGVFKSKLTSVPNNHCSLFFAVLS